MLPTRQSAVFPTINYQYQLKKGEVPLGKITFVVKKNQENESINKIFKLIHVQDDFYLTTKKNYVSSVVQKIFFMKEVHKPPFRIFLSSDRNTSTVFTFSIVLCANGSAMHKKTLQEEKLFSLSVEKNQDFLQVPIKPKALPVSIPQKVCYFSYAVTLQTGIKLGLLIFKSYSDLSINFQESFTIIRKESMYYLQAKEMMDSNQKEVPLPFLEICYFPNDTDKLLISSPDENRPLLGSEIQIPLPISSPSDEFLLQFRKLKLDPNFSNTPGQSNESHRSEPSKPLLPPISTITSFLPPVIGNNQSAFQFYRKEPILPPISNHKPSSTF